MKLNLSMNLPNAVRAHDIALSRQLSKQYNTHFVLGENANYPHITVYAVEFSSNDVQHVLNTTRKLAAQTKSLVCKVNRVETHHGYIGVEVVKSRAIMEFHERVVKAFAPLRAQQHGSGADYNMSFTDEQIANIEKYGYADAMRLYNPHFTITRLKDELQAEKAVQQIRWDVPEFVVRSIGIYTMGDHGTCKELLGEFVLVTAP